MAQIYFFSMAHMAKISTRLFADRPPARRCRSGRSLQSQHRKGLRTTSCAPPEGTARLLKERIGTSWFTMVYHSFYAFLLHIGYIYGF